MSHTYLIDLYELIDQLLAETAEEISRKSAAERSETAFLKGRSEALVEFKQFLAGHYNRKLPRRLQSRHPG